MSFLIFVLVAAFFLIFSLYIKERKAFLLYKKFFSHVSKLLGEKEPTPPLYLVEKLKKRFESLEEEVKRAERSRDNILTILNNLTDPIFILSKDGVIIFANDAAKSVTRENVVKRKFYEVVEDYFINEMVDEAIKTLETQVGDIVLYLNQKRYFHAKVIPVSFKDGERMFIVMLHDVTKEKKLDEMRRE
ncbi:MAG: PAS domain-containing sensor histidine kinase, partial [Thermotoga sp.]